MSDFDKEAEREKLREQFAEDDQKRESTERMSQLLLQGATMTNTHCDACGDPLFRYDGQTFCPTCQRATDDGNAESATERTPGPADADEPVSDPANDGRRIAIDSPDASAETPDTGRAVDHTDEGDTTGQRAPPTARTHTRRTPPSQSESATGTNVEHAGDLQEAEASLARTVARQASAAEQTNDLGRVREHLAAAREAAKALAAVRQAGR